MISSRRVQILGFVLFWATVATISFTIVRTSEFAAHPDIMSLAVTVDLIVLVPVVYLIVARRLGWHLLSVAPVVVLALIAANQLIPGEHHRWLDLAEILLAPLELIVIAVLVLKVRAVRRTYRQSGSAVEDFPENLQRAVGAILGSGRAARIVATEVAMLYFGLAAWRQPPPSASSRQTFSYHRECGHASVLLVFLFVIGVEAAVLHWLLLPRIAPLAWLLLGVSLYSAIFLLADLNAARLRPIVINGGDLVVRTALRWRVRVPLARIQRIERTTLDIEDRDGLLPAVLVGNQNVVLHLAAPVTASGLYGFDRTCSRIALAVDDVNAFVDALGHEDEP